MRRQTYPIDWRDEFAALQPYIDGKGGVVRVSYFGSSCAPNAFVETISSLFEGGWNGKSFSTKGPKATSIRLDPENYKVHYLFEVRTEFQKKLDILLPEPVGMPRPAGQLIGSDNISGGDQDITINYFDGESETNKRWLRDRWVQTLCREMKTFLASRRFMIVLMHGRHQDQRDFWSHLWNGSLSELTQKGLVLVHMVDVNDESWNEQDAATPDSELILSPSLTDEKVGHAVEDIANWIRRQIPAYAAEKARDLALGYVVDHRDDLPRLHKAGFWIAKLVQTQGAT